MATYSYLASAVTIPTWMMFLLMLINTAISCIVAAYMAENDVFNEEWQPRRRHHRY